MVGFQHYESDLSCSQVLLVPDVLIARDHDLIPSMFGRSDYLAVGEARPTDLGCCIDGKSLKMLPNANRNAFIKQNAAHRPSCWRSRLFGARGQPEGSDRSPQRSPRH